MMGGTAQVLWFWLRFLEYHSVRHQDNSSNNNNNNDTTTSMSVASSTDYDDRHDNTSAYYSDRLHRHTRSFVRTHTDYGMAHVAAYYKTYHRSAHDVSTLLRTAGVEPVIHDDISATMCATIATAVAGWTTVLFFALLSSHHLTRRLSDANVCEIMVVEYVLCYSVVHTLLEPLRASIKTVYVMFAQCPESLSQTFPLVYQRLQRISSGMTDNDYDDNNNNNGAGGEEQRGNSSSRGEGVL